MTVKNDFLAPFETVFRETPGREILLAENRS